MFVCVAGCQKAPELAPPDTAAGGSVRLEIRYNAIRALAYRGSDAMKDPERLDVLAEMLDEPKQMELHKVRLTKDGRETVDPAAAYGEMENALKAIVELHRKNTSMNLTVLETPLEKLSKSDNPQIRQEAERTREELTKSNNPQVRQEAERTREELKK